MILSALKCRNCKNTIYSRARHDFRTCSCGLISVDGGLDYFRISAKDPQQVESVKIEVNATKQELYNDWENSRDKYGLIMEKPYYEKISGMTLYSAFKLGEKVSAEEFLGTGIIEGVYFSKDEIIYDVIMDRSPVILKIEASRLKKIY